MFFSRITFFVKNHPQFHCKVLWLFFIASFSLMQADDSHYQSDDNAQKAKNYASIKENVSNLASLILTHQKALLENYKTKLGSHKIYHVTFSTDYIDQLKNIASDFQNHMHRLKNVIKNNDDQSHPINNISPNNYESIRTCKSVGIIGLGGLAGSGTATGAGSTAAWIGAGTLATISWPVLVGGVIVVGAGSLIAYSMTSSKVEEKEKSAIAPAPVVLLAPCSYCDTAHELISLMETIENNSKVQTPYKQVFYQVFDEEFNKKYRSLSLNENIKPSKDAVEIHAHQVVDLLGKTPTSKIFCDESNQNIALDTHPIDKLNLTVVCSMMPIANFIINVCNNPETLSKLIDGTGKAIGCIYTWGTIEKIVKKIKRDGECGFSLEEEKKEKKKENFEEIMISLSQAGVVIGAGATVVVGGSVTGLNKIIEISDNYGNKTTIELKDNKSVRIIDENIANPESYRKMINFNSPQSEKQISEDHKRQNVLDKNHEKSDKKYNNQQEKKQAEIAKSKNTAHEIEKSLNKKGINRQDHLLPTPDKKAGFAFEGIRNQSGDFLRDKHGNYLDTKGNTWKFNSDKNIWDVKTLNGSHIYVKPANNAPRSPQQTHAAEPTKMSAPESKAPKQEGCGDWKEANNGPIILESPQQEEQIPSNEGCGSTQPVEQPTDTAHEPDPELQKLQPQQLPGCGGMDAGSQKPNVLYNSSDNKTWTDKNGIVWKEGDLSGQDVRFQDGNRYHIFDDRSGHLIDTFENRDRIEKLVKNSKNYLGDDDHGNWWYAEILPDGTQLWGVARGEKITNCGLNKIPKPYNPNSGLCDFNPAKQKNINK